MQSERLIFRELEPEDFDAVAPMLRDETVMYAWEHGFSDEEIRTWINWHGRHAREGGNGYRLAVDKKTGQVVGQMGALLEDVGEQDPCWGLGYIVNRPYWHMGYATEGAAAWLAWLRKEHAAARVVCTIRPENTSSVAVALRLGMDKKGQLIKPYRGKELVHDIYEIRWPQAQR